MVATFLIAWTMASAQQAAQQTSHSIKEAEPKIGSHIRKSLVFGSDIPFDKRYAELSPAERHLFKRRWEKMRERDEPPFPRDGLGPLYRKLHAAQQQLRVDGPLDMDVEIDAQGVGRAVAVHRSPSSAMTKAAAAILMLEPYKPAVCDGQPCVMWFPVRVDLETRW